MSPFLGNFLSELNRDPPRFPDWLQFVGKCIGHLNQCIGQLNHSATVEIDSTQRSIYFNSLIFNIFWYVVRNQYEAYEVTAYFFHKKPINWPICPPMSCTDIKYTKRSLLYLSSTSRQKHPNYWVPQGWIHWWEPTIGSSDKTCIQ